MLKTIKLLLKLRLFGLKARVLKRDDFTYAVNTVSDWEWMEAEDKIIQELGYSDFH